MLHPLASLWRHPKRVLFYDSGGWIGQSALLLDGAGQARALESQRRFTSMDDAFGYLRYWSAEPDARAELKSVLQRSGASLVSAHAGTDGWLRALASRVLAGAVVVVEEDRRSGSPARLVAPPGAAATVVVAALPLLTDPSLRIDMPVAAPEAVPVADEPEATAPSTESDTPEIPAAIAAQIAQAKSLEEAAKQGTPFCEICAAARTPAPEQSASDQVQIRQAETLEIAARNGTPFCEACQKAANANREE